MEPFFCQQGYIGFLGPFMPHCNYGNIVLYAEYCCLVNPFFVFAISCVDIVLEVMQSVYEKEIFLVIDLNYKAIQNSVFAFRKAYNLLDDFLRFGICKEFVGYDIHIIMAFHKVYEFFKAERLIFIVEDCM